jgi:uncharacterized protein YaiL (DUF2058 family)
VQDLRDKLLKAGAIDKKQARKARTEARKQKKKKLKKGGKVDAGREQEQEQRERFEAKQAEERAEVQRRQAELNREAEQRAQESRIQDLIRAHAIKVRPSKTERPFHYVGPDRRIRRIHVSPDLANQLASGLLAIVETASTGEGYALVDADGARRLEELAPKLILFWSNEDNGDLPTYGDGS